MESAIVFLELYHYFKLNRSHALTHGLSESFEGVAAAFWRRFANNLISLVVYIIEVRQVPRLQHEQEYVLRMTFRISSL